MRPPGYRHGRLPAYPSQPPYPVMHASEHFGYQVPPPSYSNAFNCPPYLPPLAQNPNYQSLETQNVEFGQPQFFEPEFEN